MPQNTPEVEVDNSISAPMPFRHVKHARKWDTTRGVQIGVGTEQSTHITFMTYDEAVKLHEALGNALAFLDADGE